MEKFTRITFITAVVLLVYGYFARWLSIYFFWDSKALGWMLLLPALMGFLFGIVSKRKMAGKRTFWAKLGAWFLALMTALIPVILILIRTSVAYKTATEFIKSDAGLKTELGNIKGFGLLTTGSISVSTINGLTSGEAELQIVVKGSKKYKDITVLIVKTPDKDWTVVYAD